MKNFVERNMKVFEPKKIDVRIGEFVIESVIYANEEDIATVTRASYGHLEKLLSVPTTASRSREKLLLMDGYEIKYN